MDYEQINSKLKQLKIENFIWVIYIFIIFLSWFANSLEKKYFIYNDNYSKDKYRHIMIFIFSILIVVYYYFLQHSYKDYKNLSKNDSCKKQTLIFLSFLASLLIFISGLIFLYIAYKDESLEVELAFN